MESFEKNWYVLHTYSGYENKVKANIESRAQSMKMADFIFRVVVPEEKETEVKNGKEKEIVHKSTITSRRSQSYLAFYRYEPATK